MDWLKEVKHEYILTNGVKLHTAMIGSGAPLILLHGFPDFWFGWAPIIPELRKSYRLIIPDLRGYNLSDKPQGKENYLLDILVEDLKGLSEKLNLKKFYLGAQDWGAVIAWAFTEKYPEMVKKLATLNGPHPKIFQYNLRTNKEQQKASFYIFEFLKPQGEKFLLTDNFKALKAAVFGAAKNKDAFDEFTKQKYLEAWSQTDAIVSGVNYYRANVNFDKLTGIINVPTLVIHGMQDQAVLPQNLNGLSEYVKDLKVQRVENASHWVIHDKPEVIISNFKKFFRD
ncbi:MAG: alpha/beta fold hydrolase [Candidatus Hodarchaeota archaeon]